MKKIPIHSQAGDEGKALSIGKKLLDWKKIDENSMEDVEDFLSNFSFSGKSPKGFKKEFESLKLLKKSVDLNKEYGNTFGVDNIRATFSRWNEEDLKRIVRAFVGKGNTQNVVKQGNLEFYNHSSMGEKRFLESSKVITKLLGRFKGSHKKALTGKLVIRFQPAKEMKAKATYKTDKDEIWIKDSPKVSALLKKELYGWLPYIIVHELGHRYEKKKGHPSWYDRRDFITTKYSKQEHFLSGGEDFAEVFALSFFGKGVHPDYKQWESKVESFKDQF